MSVIAQKLDKLEKELLGITDNFYSISGNVDDDGNYNIQVLQEALKEHKVEIVPLKKNEAATLLETDYDNLGAFIFNSTTHWFSIRKIEGVWFNLNSTNAFPGPQIISDFYLSAFIKGTEELGFSNFLCKNLNELSSLDSPIYSKLSFNQRLADIDDILKKNKPKKINMGDTDDEQLERILELSKKEFEGKTNPINTNNNNNNNINNQYQAFIGNGIQVDNGIFFSQNEENNILDDDLKTAMELSLTLYCEELEKGIPQEPNFNDINAINLLIKCGDKSFSRRFNKSDKIRDVNNFMKAKLRTYNTIELFENLPKKVYSDESKSLEESGISNNLILMAKILN